VGVVGRTDQGYLMASMPISIILALTGIDGLDVSSTCTIIWRFRLDVTKVIKDSWQFRKHYSQLEIQVVVLFVVDAASTDEYIEYITCTELISIWNYGLHRRLSFQICSHLQQKSVIRAISYHCMREAGVERNNALQVLHLLRCERNRQRLDVGL